uniref:Uncharacterized protein n=1 Tax=Cucumis melo TaxID=3656 RepID=A0A9I9DAH1_CUCME
MRRRRRMESGRLKAGDLFKGKVGFGRRARHGRDERSRRKEKRGRRKREMGFVENGKARSSALGLFIDRSCGG